MFFQFLAVAGHFDAAGLASAARQYLCLDDGLAGAEFAMNAGSVFGPARDLAVARKNTFYTVPAAEVGAWQKASEAVVADWVKEVAARGMDGNKLVADAKSLMK